MYKQKRHVLYGGQEAQEYYGTFLLYAQKAKNFTRQNH